mmetsp:Transcript_437/g.1097  ORF Transcript_437/g.1097 Transcript_437/m.1097 type:complete len:226 (-) Transcript_437:1121-1798(-)
MSQRSLPGWRRRCAFSSSASQTVSAWTPIGSLAPRRWRAPSRLSGLRVPSRRVATLLTRCGTRSRRHGNGWCRWGCCSSVTTPMPTALLTAECCRHLCGERARHTRSQQGSSRGTGPISEFWRLVFRIRTNYSYSHTTSLTWRTCGFTLWALRLEPLALPQLRPHLLYSVESERDRERRVRSIYTTSAAATGQRFRNLGMVSPMAMRHRIYRISYHLKSQDPINH